MTGYITIDHNKANVKADQSFDTCSAKYYRTPALYKIRWSVDTRELFRHTGTGLCSHCGFLQGWHFCAAQLLQWLFENQPLSVQTWTPSLGSTEEAARQTVGFRTLTQKCFFFSLYSGYWERNSATFLLSYSLFRTSSLQRVQSSLQKTPKN